ncbi:MAG: glycosyl transferase [Rhodobacteraceae bacterium]|nr:glycosyl transferase [Paracoccaceae bacterium]
MPGDGTRPGITTPERPTARLLDLTRSLRRAGRVATGVDRVELAYGDALLSDQSVPVFGLARTAFGYLLLDASGVREFIERLTGREDWGAPDLLSRLPRGRSAVLRRAEADLRRLAIARAVPGRLARMLSRNLPQDYAYLNVGHSNITDRVFGAVHASGGRIAVLVHDVIPLEHPDLQRPGTVSPFRDKMQRVAQDADLVIYNSADTRKRAETFMRGWGRMPPAVVVHLGVERPIPVPADLPAHLPPEQPYFVTVGTIEPRKNHAFLLDLWEQMGPSAPRLVICGNRGWNNAAVFARLDALRADDRVIEAQGLSDGAVAALVQGAAGTLFPSLSEGFGLPPVESAALGTRVLCNDLEVLKEVLGVKAHFLSVAEPRLWINTIENWASNPPETHQPAVYDDLNWDSHFKTVLRLT